MTLLKKAVVVACMAIALAAFQAPVYAADKEAVAKLFEQVQLGYEVFTLPNGLTTLVYPDHKVPEVYVGIYYRVGSKDEPKGKTGFAHLYEHLMFQGTKNAPGEFFSYITHIGGSGVNGTTSTERTNYFQTVPTGSLDAALWLESDRMANILGGVTQELLDEQRAVVKNEKRQGELRPGWKAFEAFTKHFYPVGHPYNHTTIGSMEDLNKASLEDFHQWFKDYYGATNAILVLAGDVDVATAKAKVAHYFSDVQPGKALSKIEEYIPAFSENKRVLIYDKVPQTSVSRTWPLPNGSSRDFALMQFMAPALAGDKESPLNRLLVDELEYVTDINIRPFPGEVSSSFTLSYSIRKESGATKEQIDAIIDRELRNFFKQGPNRDILDDVSRAADAALVRSMKRSKELAIHLAESLLYHDDPEFFKTARQWEMEAKTKDLKKLAKKWLDQPYFELVTEPEPVTQALQPVVDRSFIPPVTETVAKVEFPEFEETTLKNGMKLVVVKQSGIPMVDVSFQIDAGTGIDTQYSDGTAARTFQLMTKATKKYDENALIGAQKRLATSMQARADQYTSTFSFNSLSPYLDESFALAAEILINPIYPEKEFRKALEQIDRDYDALEADAGLSVKQLFDTALWGREHRFGKILTREQAKRSVSREQVVKFHKNEIGPNNTTVYMSGDISLKEGKKLLTRHFGSWRQSKPTSNKGVANAKSMTGKVILVDNPGTPSAIILAGHMAAPFDKSTAAALSLANAPLGGVFESRINMNLREDKGWSYGAGSDISQNPYFEQIFSVRTQVQTDKVVPSIKEIIQELENYVTTQPISKEELNRVRNTMVKSYPSEFSDDLSYIKSALTSRAYGLPFDYAEGYVDRLNKVTLKQAQDISRQTIKPDELVWLVVGDLARFEKEMRDLDIGEVEVWDVYGNKLR